VARFFMLWPFLKRLKTYIKQRRKNIRAGKVDKRGEIRPPPVVDAPEVQGAAAQEGEGGSQGKKRRKKKKKNADAVQDVPGMVEAPEPEEPHIAQISHRSLGPSAWLSFQLDEAAVLRKLEAAW
jgi:hypothetical protein